MPLSSNVSPAKNPAFVSPCLSEKHFPSRAPVGAEIAISPGFAWFFVLLAPSPFAASASSYHFESIAPPQHPGYPPLQADSAPTRIVLPP